VDLDISSTQQANKYSTLLYEETFEISFLQETQQFYQHYSNDYLSNHTVLDYLEVIETLFNQENQRVDRYLHHTTRSKVTRTY
jgi:cullin 1